MKNRISRFLYFILFILILLVIGGGWWLLRPAGRAAQEPPASPVQVFLLSPASDEEVSAGDYLPVTVQVIAPEAIVSAELFVDGKSLGVVSDSPESAWWTWQAWPAGIHTLSAQAIDADGQVGLSQTAIVTVLEGAGVTATRATGGQTLEQIGAAFGVPPDQMASANPHVDPAQPLASGQPVQVPTGGGAGGDASEMGDAAAAALIPDLITWQFQPTQPVDKAYCYTSFGDGNWHKMPKQPFDFFSGGGVKYSQYGFNLTGEETLIEAQCWGWLGGDLKFLGEGETQFDIQQPPQEVVLTGSGFQLVGLPEMKPMAGGGSIPPPYALREPSSKGECLQNHGIGALYLCELLDQAHDRYVLVWEWQAPPCWPGQECITIDGYRVYEIDPMAQTEKLLKQLDHQGLKAAVVPMGWGTCFGVRAYLNTPELSMQSPMATWCPGQEPQPKQITYQPSHVLTVGAHEIWRNVDCGGVAELWYTPFEHEAMVGINEVDTFMCGATYDGTAGVKFPVSALPSGAVLHKATLRYTTSEMINRMYLGNDLGLVVENDTWAASNVTWLCPTNVGTATVDWTGWDDHFTFAPPHLDASMEPYMTLPEFGEPIDITPLVRQWLKSPQTNLGLVFDPDEARFYNAHFSTDATIQECFNFFTDWQLDVFYFEP